MLGERKVHPDQRGRSLRATPSSSVVPALTDTQVTSTVNLSHCAKSAEPDQIECVGPQATTIARHQVTMRDMYGEVTRRDSARRFWFKCIGCLLHLAWNIASPMKAYMLSFYGLSGDDLVFSHSLNWTSLVDYQYARSLYDTSGITYTAPEGKPIRFVNMYIDFVIFNRATKWARYLNDLQQDPHVGLFCRTSLVPKGDRVRKEMDPYCTEPGFYAGNNLLEQTKCHVNEVSEAIMCLKGIDVLTLLNYEWKSSYDPNNTYIQQGARLYQNAVFPDLDACLTRRGMLVKLIGRDEALVQLTHELATNFSLDPIGFGGKRGLYQEFRFTQGFRDLAGSPSGERHSKMSGSLPERTLPFEAELNALVLGRERLWWLVSLSPKAFRDGVVNFAFYAPYLFFGMHIDNHLDSGRFVDRYSIEKADTIGICQNWNLALATRKTSYPNPIYLDAEPEESVLTAYGTYFVSRVISEHYVTDQDAIVAISSRLSTICITRDGCMDACKVAHSSGWLATFDRSGVCRDRFVSSSVLNRQGYVSWQCFGEGAGNETLSIKTSEPIPLPNGSSFEYTEISGIANPAAIVACVLGGRIPQQGDEPYPNVFFDLIKSGPNTIITTTLRRGSEKLLVNMYALISLLGCAVFSGWVIQNAVKVLQMLKRAKASGQCDSRSFAQLVDSCFAINFSTVSHGRNIQLSKVILWLNLVTWYIGAADINCTWWVDGVDLWSQGADLKPSDSPYYKCKTGNFISHLISILGVTRVVSMSYNFKSLTCQHSILRGATRHVRSLVCPIVLFGLLPILSVSSTITAINHLRHQMGVFETVHNQFFIVVLWLVCLISYHHILHYKIVAQLYVGLLQKLNVCGKQKVRPGSVAAVLVGPYYLTLPEYVRAEETEWIPLSVAMESPNFKWENLNFATRTYSFTGNPTTERSTRGVATSPPQWVLDDSEFFFC